MKKPNHQKTDLREVFGTVLTMLPAARPGSRQEREETNRTYHIYWAEPSGRLTAPVPGTSTLTPLQQPSSREMMLLFPFCRGGS